MFYTSAEDEVQLLRFVMTTGSIEILPSKMDSASSRFTELPDPLSDLGSIKVFLYNRDIAGGPPLEKSEEDGFYHPAFSDFSDAPIVEFFRSVPRPEQKRVSRGRIAAHVQHFSADGSAPLRKPIEFEGWYDILAKWVRKNFSKASWSTFAGDGALNLQKQGWELQ